MTPDAAQVLGLQALAFLAADDQRLNGLLAQSGIDPADLRRRAQDPHLLAGVLDYLLSDERLVLDFCAETGVKPEAPARARAALPGGGVLWE